jgi:isopentenyl-diphosphate delta-isomerase
MGFDCPLQAVFGFVYRAALDRGLVEHEFDHVVVGRFQGAPAPDAGEVEEWKWERVPAIQSQLAEDPGAFTAWFELALDGLLARGLP